MAADTGMTVTDKNARDGASAKGGTLRSKKRGTARESVVIVALLAHHPGRIGAIRPSHLRTSAGRTTMAETIWTSDCGCSLLH